MKRLLSAVAALTLLVPAMPAQAGYSQSGGVKERTCYREVYREEYIPGTQEQPGRVRRWTETRKVPCNGRVRRPGPRNPRNRRPNPRQDFDDNSCIEGSILGGIAGGAAGAALSRNEGNFIGIPLGIVGGALVGCQIDGG